MKKLFSILAVCLFMFSSICVVSAEEATDFSAYTTDNLIKLRIQLDGEISKRIVQENSSLAPTALYEGEIMFRGIPWDTNAIDVRTKLAADGMISSGHKIDNDDFVYVWKIAESLEIESHSGANIAVYDFPSTFSVAGYPLASAQIYCPYGYTETKVDRTVEGTKFMLAEMTFDVSDIELVYADLTNKLTSLYGKPEEVIDNNSYTIFLGDMPDYTRYNSWMIWYGANNTGVFLYKTYTIDDGSTVVRGPELKLVYGKTNGIQYLDYLTEAAENEKKAQDQLLQQQNANNTDGL